MSPLISIVIPTYNRGRYICNAIESCFTQTYRNIEVIVVDDGSTDDTRQRVLAGSLGRARYLIKEHSGAPATRNRGIKEARGDYILWLDSDDVLLADTALRYVETLKTFPDADILYGNLQITDSQLNDLRLLEYPDWYGQNSALLARMLQQNSVPNPGTLVRKSLYSQFGGYDERFPRAHDYEWWCRIVKTARFKHLNQLVVKWRWHDTNMSSDSVSFDTSYDAKIVKLLVERHSLKELFPDISWNTLPHDEATALAFLKISRRLIALKDLVGAKDYLQRSYDTNPQFRDKDELLRLLQALEQHSQSDPKNLERAQLSENSKSQQKLGFAKKLNDPLTSSSKPKVSVIVPTLNREQMLKTALQSVLGQTYENYEIIVVNDGGKNVSHIIDQLEHNGKITQTIHPKSKGLPAARNTALKLASGKYIAYLDDDDRFLPDHLETLVSFLESNQETFKVAYTDAWRVDQQLEKGQYKEKSRQVIYSFDFNADRMLVENYIPVLCVMHQRACLDEVGMFDETLTSHEDWDLWMRMSQKYDFAHIKKTTSEFTWRTDQSSMTSSRPLDYLRTMEIIFEKNRALVSSRPEVSKAQQQRLNLLRQQLIPSDIKCSIIIPVWNKFELTIQCLTQLARVTKDVRFELIVVDNASTDGTSAFLAGIGGNVQIITNQSNLGFAKACNQGAKAARGPYLVFLNNDTIPTERWLEALVEEVETNPEVAVVGSKLLYPNGTVQHAGVALSRFFETPYHLYAGAASQLPAVNKRREFNAVTGACMLVRKEAFEAVDGFYEGYINSFEDIDLCLKIRQKGGRIVYQPKSVLYHLESQTPGRKDHDLENIRLFRERWMNSWWPDEDIIYLSDGYVITEIENGNNVSHRLRTIESKAEKRQWELVVEVELQGRAGNLAAVRSSLSKPGLWPNDAGALRWAAKTCHRIGLPQYAQGFLSRINIHESVQKTKGKLVVEVERQGDSRNCALESSSLSGSRQWTRDRAEKGSAKNITSEKVVPEYTQAFLDLMQQGGEYSKVSVLPQKKHFF